MSVLGNPRYERAAQILAAGGSAETAAAAAEYNTKGSSFRANARRLIQRPDIRARVKELQGQVADRLVDITVEFIEQSLAKIAAVNVSEDEIKASDVIAALRELAKIRGIYAPEKKELTGPDGGPLEIKTITRTIVEPEHPDGEDIPPAA
jgi:hypothetical protein